MADLKAKVAAATLALSVGGTAALVGWEGGYVPTVYLDAVKVPTVCAGHTAGLTTADVGKRYGMARCAELLRSDLRVAESTVRGAVRVPITQGQYDVLVDFVHNKGPGAFRSSTLLKRINAGQCGAAGKEFLRWTYADGRQLKGLVRRAEWQSTQWLRDC